MITRATIGDKAYRPDSSRGTDEYKQPHLDKICDRAVLARPITPSLQMPSRSFLQSDRGRLYIAVVEGNEKRRLDTIARDLNRLSTSQKLAFLTNWHEIYLVQDSTEDYARRVPDVLAIIQLNTSRGFLNRLRHQRKKELRDAERVRQAEMRAAADSKPTRRQAFWRDFGKPILIAVLGAALWAFFKYVAPHIGRLLHEFSTR